MQREMAIGPDRKVIHKEATVKMLRVLSGDTNVDDTGDALKEMGIKEEDEIRVCELFDQYTRKGIAQGISQGISQGSCARDYYNVQGF